MRVVVAAVSTVGVAGVDENHLRGCSQGVSNWMSPWDNLPSRTGHDESVAAAGDGDARKHSSTRTMVAEPVLLIWRRQNLKL